MGDTISDIRRLWRIRNHAALPEIMSVLESHERFLSSDPECFADEGCNGALLLDLISLLKDED